MEDFDIIADDKVLFEIRGNHQRLVTISADIQAKSLKLVIRKIRADREKCGVFAFDAE